MKFTIINNMFRRISYTPYEDVIKENLGEISKDALIKEINVLFPKIKELVKETLMVAHNRDIETLIDEKRYINLEQQDEKEVLVSYQLLFNYILEIGKFLINLKNLNSTNIPQTWLCLEKLDLIIDLADHHTDVDIKEKMDISNFGLPYIKLQNTYWKVVEYTRLYENLYRICEGTSKRILPYCLEVKKEAQRIKDSCDINLPNRQIKKYYKEEMQLLVSLERQYYKEFNKVEREILGDEYEEETSKSYGVFSFFKFMMDWAEEVKKEDEKEKSDKLEKTMDNFMLEDWQKELVRKGEYDPWSFEESDELEEGDYYYEDER